MIIFEKIFAKRYGALFYSENEDDSEDKFKYIENYLLLFELFIILSSSN